MTDAGYFGFDDGETPGKPADIQPELLPTGSPNTGVEGEVLGPDCIEEPNLAPETGLGQRLGRVATSFKEDWSNASNLGRSVQVTAVLGQAVERSRISEWGVVPIAVDILRDTQSPTITGLAVLGMVGAMQGVIGHSWAEGVDVSPKTFNAVNKEFPSFVELSEDFGPAKEKKWYSHLREGAAMFLTYGVTPFVVSEKINTPEMTRREIHASTAKLTGKCALFGFGITFAASEVLINADPVLANDVMNVIDKPLFWMGLAAVFEVPRFAVKRYNRYRERRAEKRLAKQTSSQDDTEIQ